MCEKQINVRKHQKKFWHRNSCVEFSARSPRSLQAKNTKGSNDKKSSEEPDERKGGRGLMLSIRFDQSSTVTDLTRLRAKYSIEAKKAKIVTTQTAEREGYRGKSTMK